MSRVTEEIKQALWATYGVSAPAEWDGRNFGGGRISQRFWEYFKTIELLGLTSASVVLDVGGFSAATGIPFFADVIAPFVRKVIVLDPSINRPQPAGNVRYIRSDCSLEALRRIFTEEAVTHVACISVLEHMPDENREILVKALDDLFKGKTCVMSFEYHPVEQYVDNQLTMKAVSETFRHFRRFYLSSMEASPTLSVNAFRNGLPLWYPLILKFRSVEHKASARGASDK